MAHHILVVDDSTTMRRAINVTFAYEDFDLTTVADGAQALKALGDNTPDLALIDANLNGETGVDLAHKIREEYPESTFPMVLMHSNQAVPTDAELTSAGIAGQVARPFHTQELIDHVKGHLGLEVKKSVAAMRFVPRSARQETAPEPPPVQNEPVENTPPVAQPDPVVSSQDPVEALTPPPVILGAPPPAIKGPPPPAPAQAKKRTPPAAQEEPLEPALIMPPPVEESTPEPILITPPPVEEQAPEPVLITPPPAEESTPEPIHITPPPVEEQAPEPVLITPPPAEESTPEPILITPPPVEEQAPPPLEPMPIPVPDAPTMVMHPVQSQGDDGTFRPEPTLKVAALTSAVTDIGLGVDLAAVAEEVAAGTKIHVADGDVELESLMPVIEAAVRKVTAEAVERVVWEVVPDLAERLIREHLSKRSP